MFRKKIQTRTVNPDHLATLIQSGADPLLAQLYAARAVQNPDELDDHLQLLIPYQQLTNCERAAQRLAQAIEQQEKILIIADYDADGATACSVAMKGLGAMGAVVDFFVPNRFEHGYGLTPELADIAAQKGANLIVTVDNGISSREGVARAYELGMDVLVTDHHHAGDHVPDCIIVNPNQKGCTFPSKNLAGVGVIFYVLMALRAELRARHYFSGSLKEPNLGDLLDLVAVGTVADVVPLDHNNRILVSQGLKRIRAGKTGYGILALFQAARYDAKKAQPMDIGFKIAPRINAAGRLDDMSVGIACLLAQDWEMAQSIAAELNELNHTRQEIEQGMLQQILGEFPDRLPENQTTLTAYRPDFHQGVVGIVASRLKDKFYRPTFVFAPDDDGNLRGSGRSIQGVHLRDVVDTIAKQCPDLIYKFGGHAMAAGLTMRGDGLAQFQAAFEDVVAKLVDKDILSQIFLTDGSLNAADLTLERVQFLATQVWGQGFPQPTFCDEFVITRQQSMGADGKHRKAWLKKNGQNQQEVEAVFWRCEHELPEEIRVVYRPVVNEWGNRVDLQLYVEHWEEVLPF
ncbi:single-stranded-DNA-specific exonuclease RecJ [Alysiella crassa]|uniref:Single-stranded-DNA-specific exonuclease RecJ n=1 Tax=Alysiella crassa TaxID=153491 RepID=A0A376BN33_9NEIS|nr:single-stranded-DNA-specific exonuclease RecJ [Alysiella crassa]UOP06800.1 single-stranded-DNA-specific exonuclease RecJ [Alysiella crassa]SSY71078.1 Single-stranded-DNA-specific exonuclease recJ [Alysiella crassa]